MLMLPAGIKIYVSAQSVSMQHSFDGLSRLAEEQIAKDPLSGHLFVFFNKRNDKVKILYWDRNGYCIWYKRLELGVFRRPRVQDKKYELTVSELSMLLEGVDLTEKKRLPSLQFS